MLDKSAEMPQVPQGSAEDKRPKEQGVLKPISRRRFLRGAVATAVAGLGIAAFGEGNRRLWESMHKEPSTKYKSLTEQFDSMITELIGDIPNYDKSIQLQFDMPTSSNSSLLLAIAEDQRYIIFTKPTENQFYIIHNNKVKEIPAGKYALGQEIHEPNLNDEQLDELRQRLTEEYAQHKQFMEEQELDKQKPNHPPHTQPEPSIDPESTIA